MYSARRIVRSMYLVFLGVSTPCLPSSLDESSFAGSTEGSEGREEGGGGERDRPAATGARLFRRFFPRNPRALNGAGSLLETTRPPVYVSEYEMHVATARCLLFIVASERERGRLETSATSNAFL